MLFIILFRSVFSDTSWKPHPTVVTFTSYPLVFPDKFERRRGSAMAIKRRYKKYRQHYYWPNRQRLISNELWVLTKKNLSIYLAFSFVCDPDKRNCCFSSKNTIYLNVFCFCWDVNWNKNIPGLSKQPLHFYSTGIGWESIPLIARFQKQEKLTA